MFLKKSLVFSFIALLLLASAARTAEKATPTKEKEFVFKVVERNARAIALTGDNVFYFGELGMQEFETAELMTDLLGKGGFNLERGISGFPTGFCATYGSGHPVVAIHTEYDSCPDNSQVPGVAEQKFIVEGAPGHCEGHNVNAAVLVPRRGGEAGDGQVRAQRHAESVRRPGRGAARRPAVFRARRLVRRRRYRLPQSHRRRIQADPRPAAIGADLGDLHFHGETAHAGVAPWKGRDALDGVVLMDAGWRRNASI